MPNVVDRRAPLVPMPMLVLFAALLTTPLWLTQVGLYQYLALEIMIWMLFALGYNLLLGYAGLPSFGHGAYFGIGAYAFGLLELRVVANLWLDLAGAALAAAVVRRARCAVHLASPRHLLRVADDRLRPGVLVRRGQMALGHRRRGRPPQPAPPPGGLRLRRLSI